MKFSVMIDTNNSDFDGDNRGAAISRILKTIIREIESPLDQADMVMTLRDINGNSVGTAELIIDSPSVSVCKTVSESIMAEMNTAMNEIKGNIETWTDCEDEDMVKMFRSDYDYAEYCLNEFKSSNDMKMLRRNLYNQDTAARENFCVVFDLIDAALVE